MHTPQSFAIVAPNPETRARIRGLLESAGLHVVADGRTVDDALAGHVVPDLLVIEAPRTSNDGDENEEPKEALTARERDVLEWLSFGLSNRAIGARLGISEHTVKFHIASIYGKLGASSRAQVIRRAARRGLITI